MTLVETATIAGAAASILTVVVRLHFSNVRRLEDAAVERAEVRVKVNALWQFHLDQAKLSAERKGYGTRNSPFHVAEQGMALVPAELRASLRTFYRTLEERVREDENFLGAAIQMAFRKRLLDEVCRPHNLEGGECLVLAMAVAVENQELLG